MEETTKKQIMIALVIVCLIAAAVIVFKTRRGSGSGISDIPAGEKTWVKCANPDCAAEYEMNARKYHKDLQEKITPATMLQQVALACKECSEESIYRALKCPECGKVFFRGAAGRSDFADRCPECKHSVTEEKRKARRAAKTTE